MKNVPKRKIQASWVFPATLPIMENASIILDGEQIIDVLPSTEADLKYPDVKPEVYEGCTVIPGLINCHSHVMMPGNDSSDEDMGSWSDHSLLLQSYMNGLKSLVSGVTTLVDLGSQDNLIFSLRDALKRTGAPTPRLLVSGRPITSVRGHAWQMNGEVTTIEEMQSLARDVFARGADVLKIMATGGGTPGTDPFSGQFSEEFFQAAAEEARKAGKPSVAHLSATEVTRQLLKAGFNIVAHGSFHDKDGNLSGWDDECARLALEHGTYWNPTLAVARSGIRKMEREGTGDPQELEAKKKKWASRADGVRRLHEYGVPILAGSDEGYGPYVFGGHFLELEALVEAGISDHDVLLTTTSLPAKALQISDKVGSLEAGKDADLVIVGGRPFKDIQAMKNVKKVIKGGYDVTLEDMFIPEEYRT